jgi:hypothetical protein
MRASAASRSAVQHLQTRRVLPSSNEQVRGVVIRFPPMQPPPRLDTTLRFAFHGFARVNNVDAKVFVEQTVDHILHFYQFVHGAIERVHFATV